MKTLLERWTTDPLEGKNLALTAEENHPQNCQEFLQCERIRIPFSTTADYPIGKTKEQAQKYDEKINTKKFGFPDPIKTLAATSLEFYSQSPNKEVISRGLEILKTLFDQTTSLVFQYEDMPLKELNEMRRNQLELNRQEALALAQCIRLVEELFKNCS